MGNKAQVAADSGKDESKKRSKKRHRDANVTNGTERERKHKRSKSAAPSDETPADAVINGQETSQKQIIEGQGIKEEDGEKKRSKKEKRRAEKAAVETEQSPAGVTDSQPEKKKKNKKKSRENAESHDAEHKVVVISSKRTDPPASKQPPSSFQYPFYTQTVSQYLPLHPSGASDPIQGYTSQHLKPLLNRYVPGFRGVLLSYRNVRVGEAPGRASIKENGNTDGTVLLESINEHAVCYAWLTAEIDIFMPRRGAWLEGIVNFQSPGHIGVVCWGKFNASVESERLPRGWKWINQLEEDQGTDKDADAMEIEAVEDHAEVHATGYWVDESGGRVTSDAPIRFRIKKYEIPVSGDHGYLILEGTMLSEEEEDAKVTEEMEKTRDKIRHGVTLRKDRRPLLESSITKFGEDDEKEREGREAEAEAEAEA
ncbi:hypothetical protein GGS20DRAFT_111183 [Poronia punctata]|nr:hypothetical protein GGS20DRAFT_111183 [Poronia punctata]